MNTTLDGKVQNQRFALDTPYSSVTSFRDWKRLDSRSDAFQVYHQRWLPGSILLLIALLFYAFLTLIRWSLRTVFVGTIARLLSTIVIFLLLFLRRSFRF